MKKMKFILLGMLLMSPFSIYAKEIEEESLESNVKTEIVTLESCVDGDTARFFNRDNELIKARFLAIDTPETVHPTKGVEPFGKEASDYTCDSLTNAKEIKLEYDDNSTEEDYYGRKLVWVFVDDVLLQDLLVSKGYAEVAYLYNDYKYTPLLQDSEAVAKAMKLGIWSIEETEPVVKEQRETKKQKKEKKGFFDKLFDQLTSTVIKFFDDLLEKLLKMIEDML